MTQKEFIEDITKRWKLPLYEIQKGLDKYEVSLIVRAYPELRPVFIHKALASVRK